VATKSQVKSFLVRLRSDVQFGKTTLARRKNSKINKLLREFGWTRKIMFNYLIQKLSYKDYLSGPEADHNGSLGEIWEFGKLIYSKNVYIKIKIHPNGTKFLSFHEANKPFTFVFEEE